ncbi:MAG: anhydro-N-acetylmuramic acid kinase [Cyclobacteriaceae bacterium]
MSIKSKYSLIGLMSGTSGDGLDIAYCHFNLTAEKWQFDINKATTIHFPPSLKKSLKTAHLLPSEELAVLDHQFGRWMGVEVKRYCGEHSLSPLAIASHGHTVFHRPEINLTKQIGNGYSLWQGSGLPVINDFRTLDLVLGGQGAPLVPIGDALLFGNYDFALNLGGIANISMDRDGKRIAFDICPFNLIFNYLSEKLGEPFDAGGQWAKEGQVIPSLLTKLEELTYYKNQGAKSLGREDIEKHYLPLLKGGKNSIKDLMATLSAHFVNRIAAPVLQYGNKGNTLLITGGGAYNDCFIERLSLILDNKVTVYKPEKKIIDFKEAMVFAFLGVLKMRGEINCLASVTGAKMDSCGGTLFGF